MTKELTQKEIDKTINKKKLEEEIRKIKTIDDWELIGGEDLENNDQEFLGLKELEKIGQTHKRRKNMSNEKTNVPTYELKDKNGKIISIRFTGKRKQILDLVLNGKTSEEIAAEGFSKNTVSVVKWQAKKIGLLNTSPEVTKAV